MFFDIKRYKKVGVYDMLGTDVAIDLGTSNIRVFIPEKGVIVDEPCVIAVDNRTDNIVAVGKQAYDMIGKTSDKISVVYPLANGVVSDFVLVEQLIKHFLKKAGSNMVIMPRVVACIPGEVTDVEKRAVVNAISTTGVRKICLIEEPVAAAIGAGIDIFTPHGSFVIDIGGGTTDMAIISLSGVSNMKSIKIAGQLFDQNIIKYVRKEYNLIIGTHTAENAKKSIGCVYPQKEICEYRIKGRDAIKGLPKAIVLNSKEVFEAISDQALQIAKMAQDILEETPPELAGDIYTDGIVLTGGCANIVGFKELIQNVTGLPVKVANEPELCVIRGVGEALKYIDNIKHNEYGILNPLIEGY